MKRNYEQLAHRRARRKKWIVGCLVFLGIGILAIYIGITRFTSKAPDTAEGLKAIRELEEADVASVEEKIDGLEEEEAPRDIMESGVLDKSRFESAVVMGDSITSGLTEYEILNTENVVADIGIEIDNADDAINRAAGLSPKYVFLTYGENDIEATNGDAKVFGEQYRELIDKVQKAMPEAEIYVNSILPVQQKEIDREPSYANLPAYNEELKLMCEEEKLTFIDNTELVKDEYYQPDGIHMSPEYYPIWVVHMAEVAKL